MKYKFKRAWVIAICIIVISSGLYVGRSYYLKQKYPCRYRTHESLMREYPALKEIWKRKIAYLDTREAAEKILSAKLELAVKRGAMTEAKALALEEGMFNKTLAVDARFDEEFEAECRRLTRTQ